MRESNTIGVGVQMARGREPDRAWADALAESPEAVEEIYFDLKAGWKATRSGRE